jgi:hypothetical protein
MSDDRKGEDHSVEEISKAMEDMVVSSPSDASPPASTDDGSFAENSDGEEEEEEYEEDDEYDDDGSDDEESLPSIGPTRRILIFADVASFRNRAGYDVSHYMKLMSLATSTLGTLYQDDKHGPIWCTSEEQMRQVGDVDFTPHGDLLRLHDDDESTPTAVYVILVGDQSPMTNAPIPFEDLTVTTLRNIALQCSALVLMGTGGGGGSSSSSGSDDQTIASTSGAADENEAAFMVQIISLLPLSTETERFVSSGCDMDPGLPPDLDPSNAKDSDKVVVPSGTGPQMEHAMNEVRAKTQTPAKERRAKERAEQRRKKEDEERRILKELYNALIDTRVSAPSRDDRSVTLEQLANYKPRVIGRSIRPNLSYEFQVLNQSRSEDNDVIVVFVEDAGFELATFLQKVNGDIAPIQEETPVKDGVDDDSDLTETK